MPRKKSFLDNMEYSSYSLLYSSKKAHKLLKLYQSETKFMYGPIKWVGALPLLDNRKSDLYVDVYVCMFRERMDSLDKCYQACFGECLW